MNQTNTLSARQVAPLNASFQSGVPEDKVFANPDDGVYRFPAAYFYYLPPDSNVTLNFSVVADDGAFSILANFTVLGCPPCTTLAGSGGHRLCTPCSEDATYNLDGGPECVPCPEARDSTAQSSACLATLNATAYQLQSGYWLSPDATELLSCPWSGACLPLIVTLQPTTVVLGSQTWSLICHANSCHNCAPGYTDRLCARCESDYFATDTGCQLCQTSRRFFAAALGVFLLSLFLLITFHRSSLVLLLVEAGAMVMFLLIGSGEQWILEAFLLVALVYFMLNRNVSSGLLKSFLFLLQTAPAITSSQLWPPWWSEVIAKLTVFNVHFWGIECLSPTLFAQPFGKFLFYMLLPLGVIALVASLLLLAKGFKLYLIRRLVRWSLWLKDQVVQWLWSEAATEARGELDEGWTDILGDDEPKLRFARILNSEEEDMPLLVPVHVQRPAPEEAHHPSSLREKITGAALFLLFASYFELATAVLTLFQPADPDGYMPAYPWVPSHFASLQYVGLFTAGLSFALLYVLGIPALFGWLLWRYRRVIHDPEQAHALEHWLGFLYECYRPEVYWFELVWLGRRLLLAVGLSILAGSTTWSAALVLLVLLGSLLLQVRLQPFASNLENTMEVVLLYSFGLGPRTL